MTAAAATIAAPHLRPVGKVTHVPTQGVWRIQCEPHVRLRLKRVFGKVSKESYDFIDLSDTLENARDLLWFTERYPLTGSPKDLARLRARSAEHVERASVVARIVADGYVPPAFPLALPPRDYQRVAAELVLRSGGALIADDVGIGKTVEAICTFTDPRALPALVVTLTHLPKQWAAEIARFAPHLRVHILKKGTPYDIVAAMRARGARRDRTATLPGVNAWPDVIISNYHKLAGWADVLAGQVRAVVFDEVQELRTGYLRQRGMAVPNRSSEGEG